MTTDCIQKDYYRLLSLSEQMFKFEDLEIEVEYQGKETIGKYDLDFDGTYFLLTSKLTACLAEDACGISPAKPTITISDMGTESKLLYTQILVAVKKINIANF